MSIVVSEPSTQSALRPRAERAVAIEHYRRPLRRLVWRAVWLALCIWIGAAIARSL